ncbi:DGQHR domain-containing protein [Cytobacillus firmus]|nr:DGQHR domain-containing protein [Cytobacillus firmus]
MFNETHMDEVEQFAKNKQKEDLEVSTFARIHGIKGMQFNKEVFVTLIKFKDAMKFLEVFPEVQRDLNGSKVMSIKRYVLSGLENLEETMRFFPAITATARGHIFYDDYNKELAIDTSRSKLSVNDGQHRYFGVNEAIRELNGRLNKTTNKEEIQEIKSVITQLGNWVLPMTIFNNLTEREEKQLFHDTNNLAQRPSRSATIKLAQTDAFSVLARELSEENRYLKHYGVEMDKGSIAGKNPNTILLTTVHEMAKRLVWDRTKRGKSVELAKAYDKYKKEIDTTLDKLFYTLPADIDKKGKYIIDKNYTLKAIAKFIHDCRFRGIEEAIIFDAIARVDWTPNVDYWKAFGGFLSKRGLLTFGGGGDNARLAVYEALMTNLPFRFDEAQQTFKELTEIH